MSWVGAGVGAAGVVGGLLTSKDAPSTPHYGKLARQQAGLDQTMARTTTSANRPDLITPGSTTTWQQGQGFDQAGWDAGVVRQWTSPSNNVGYSASGGIKVNVKGLSIHWQASDFVYEKGGIL